jgi:hypothetical protein
VEQVVFDEAFGNTPAILDLEYRQYDGASLFFCVIDHRRRLPIGMSRAILPSDVGFKSLDDIERDWGEPLDAVLARTGLDLRRDEVWDCATVATLPDYRRGALYGLVSMALYQAVTITALRCGFRWWVAIVDEPVLRVLQWRLGRPFSEYEGLRPMSYLGSSASTPVWSDLEAWRTRLAQHDPDMHDVVFHGRGLGPAVAVPDWDDVERIVLECSPLRASRRSAGAGPMA